MSWLSHTWRDITGETARRDTERARRRQRLHELAVGPVALGDTLDAGAMDSRGGESADERRRRLRRLATIMENGGDMYGDLTLGKRGLLSR